MKTYEVTIGIPVYNAEKYIRQTMNSALSQSFDSIEFLICDDCGTDRSMDIVREYQQSHPRGNDIHIVRQPHNKGIGEGRNRLIDEAQGKYLYFMDADDLIESDTITKLYDTAIKYNAQMVYGSYERVEDFGGEVKHIQCSYPLMVFEEENQFANWAYRKYEGIQAMIWNILIEIEIFRINSIRFPSLNFWEDFVTTIILPTYITRVVMLPDMTYHYFCRYGSMSQYQHRNRIEKDEIVRIILAVEQLKAQSARLTCKPYFVKWMHKVMKTSFYIATTIIKHENIIIPAFTNEEIRNSMHSPLKLREEIMFNNRNLENFLLYLLGVLPSDVSVFFLRLVIKLRKI